MADFQDWKPVVLKKNPSKPKTEADIAKARAEGAVETQKKFLAGQNKMQAPPPNARKLDEETTDFKHQRVTQEFKVALQQARTGKKLTQAELAQRINVKASVINDYESGRAIPDPSVISKLNRVLGVVLPKIPKKKKEAGGGDEEEAAQ